MDIINYSEARANFKAVMEGVSENGEVTAITRSGGKPVVMISLELYNALTNAASPSSKAVKSKKKSGPKVKTGVVLSSKDTNQKKYNVCLLYTSPSPRDRTRSRMPSSA